MLSLSSLSAVTAPPATPSQVASPVVALPTSTLSEDKIKTTRGTVKRRPSQDSNGSHAKESRVSTPTSDKPPMAPIGSGFGGRGSAKTRGTPKRPTRPSTSKVTDSKAAATDIPSGYHDMSNVETWVCAICHLYDPATSDVGEGSGDTTEWIGCDCNRWYHKLCTKLAVVDETFCCAQVKLECLPPSPKK